MTTEELINAIKSSNKFSNDQISYINNIVYSEYNTEMLTLIELKYQKQGTHWMGLYKCSCGNEKAIQNISVKSGSTKSCGCLHGNNTASKFNANGMSNTPEYRALHAILQRCEDEKHHAYKNYGGRGITVTDRWKGDNGLDNFIDDIGLRPTDKHSIDRIDVDKGYCKENCKWSTDSEQMVNKRGYGKTSKNTGISFNKKESKWIASIYYKGKYVLQKRCISEEEAIKVRNDFIIENNLPHRLN